MDTAVPSAAPTVLAPRTKLTMIDTETNAPMEFVNGGTIFLRDTPSINVLADVNLGDNVLSVRFDYNGEFLGN
jgi:hypothetical protein